jgi:hypothetical protein
VALVKFALAQLRRAVVVEVRGEDELAVGLRGPE